MNVIETEGSETGKEGWMEKQERNIEGMEKKRKNRKTGNGWAGMTAAVQREGGGTTWWDVISEREKKRETVNAVKQQRWK